MKAVPLAGAITRRWGCIALRSIGVCVLVARCYAADSVPPPLADPNAPMARPLPNCRVGSYLLSDGSSVDIAPSSEDKAAGWLRSQRTERRSISSSLPLG